MFYKIKLKNVPTLDKIDNAMNVVFFFNQNLICSFNYSSLFYFIIVGEDQKLLANLNKHSAVRVVNKLNLNFLGFS